MDPNIIYLTVNTKNRFNKISMKNFILPEFEHFRFWNCRDVKSGKKERKINWNSEKEKRKPEKSSNGWGFFSSLKLIYSSVPHSKELHKRWLTHERGQKGIYAWNFWVKRRHISWHLLIVQSVRRSSTRWTTSSSTHCLHRLAPNETEKISSTNKSSFY